LHSGARRRATRRLDLPPLRFLAALDDRALAVLGDRSLSAHVPNVMTELGGDKAREKPVVTEGG
jgi:hypothetical protein